MPPGGGRDLGELGVEFRARGGMYLFGETEGESFHRAFMIEMAIVASQKP